MKGALFILFSFFVTDNCIAQIQDTVYIEEIDTVVLKQDPIIVNKTVYHTFCKKKKFLSIIPSVGILKDFSSYDVCESCIEAFNKLKNASTKVTTVQYGIQLIYFQKKINFGIEANYRQSSKKINYSNDSTIKFYSNVNVNYFMIGPLFGYKITEKKRWDFDLYGGILFSFTTNQRGKIIAGPYIDSLVDLSTTSVISHKNFLYHLCPSFTLKISPPLGITLATHYYFDHNSNVNNEQSYTEQRNSLGISLGLKSFF